MFLGADHLIGLEQIRYEAELAQVTGDELLAAALLTTRRPVLARNRHQLTDELDELAPVPIEPRLAPGGDGVR